MLVTGASVEIPDYLVRWTTANFAEFPYGYWRLSGAAMLMEALSRSERRTVILPAFICPSISTAALRAGKKVVHVDVDRDTLLMNRDQLRRCLAEHPNEETALLVDHPFGYPCPAVSELRAEHPRLLLIEDCVRALGCTVDGKPVGRSGDWVLLSLYKTVPGNDHGAVLLTRSPCEVRSGPVPRTTLRERLATFGPARWVYERLRRRHPNYPDGSRDQEEMPWDPPIGRPNRLTLRRFGRAVDQLEDKAARRRQAAREIQSALADIQTIRFIQPEPACQTSGYFITFTVEESGVRNRLLVAMHRKGFFLFRTWQVVPAYFRCFRDTFPFGSSESTFLAQHVCHIHIIRFLHRARRERLVRNLREFLKHA
jgi:dTDP-4-amino-4,6-dideoxygalactose transaminase